MGYRSQVAYAVVFRTTEDRDKIINDLPSDQWNLIQDDVTVEDDRILFHSDWSKWYSQRLTGMGDYLYSDVEAHEALLSAAELAHGDFQSSGGTEGVESIGIFARLGEDNDDSELNTWGQDTDGFPNWFDLVDIRREIVVGWA